MNNNFSSSMIVPKINLTCPIHRKEQIIKLCVNCQCINQCQQFYCKYCLSEEKNTNQLDGQILSHQKPTEIAIQVFAKEIESLQLQNSSLLEKMKNTNSFGNLLKDQENCEEHLKKMEDYIISQKIQIADDTANLMAIISEQIQLSKTELLHQLDQFFTSYKDAFHQFKQILDTSFPLIKEFKYFSNPNNLAAKLSTEISQNMKKKLQQIKTSIMKTRELNENKKDFIDQMQLLANNLNFMTANMPVYKSGPTFDDFSSDLIGEISKYFQEALNSQINTNDILKTQCNQKEKNNFMEQSQVPQFVRNTSMKHKSEKIFECQQEKKVLAHDINMVNEILNQSIQLQKSVQSRCIIENSKVLKQNNGLQIQETQKQLHYQ